MSRPLSLAVLLLSGVLAGGCAAVADTSPSLLPRAIESRSDAEPVRPDPVATPDAALDSVVADMLARADAAAAAFDLAADGAERQAAAARGAAEGTVPWLDAQIALAELAPLRSDLVAVAAELEQRATDRRVEGYVPYPVLTAAIARVSALVEERAARSAAIDSTLARP